jgi:hypothetical protein
VLQALKDERLRQAIEAAAYNDYGRTGENDNDVYKGIVKQHESRATKIIYNMHSTLSDFLLRYDSLFSSWCYAVFYFSSNR